MKKSLGNGRRRGVGGFPRQAIAHPPTFDPSIRLLKKFRFIQGGTPSANVAISSLNLVQMIVMAKTAVTTALLIDSLKLLKVEAWQATAQGSAATSVDVSGPQSLAGPENRKTDISVGVQPAHVVWSPAPQSASSFWIDSNSSQEMFRISCPPTTIVDVTVELILLFNPGEATAGPIPAAATAGVIYGCTLDGNGLTGNLTPADWTLLP